MSITRDQLDSWNGDVEYWRSKFQDERDRNAKLVEALDEKDDYDAKLIVRLTEDNAKLVAVLEAARQLVNDCSGVSEDMDSQVQDTLRNIDEALAHD